MIRRAHEYDLPRIAEIYRLAFPDSIAYIFGKNPSDQAFVDIYRFLLDVYPDHFLVDDDRGKVTGFVVAPPSISGLVWRAISGGYVARWVVRWFRRSYRFGFRPVITLLLDKWALLRSHSKPAETSESRMLSIAVDPDYQRRGIGKRLMMAGLDLLRKSGVEKVMLEVRAGNAPAQHIYQKMGFREVGRFEDRGGTWIQMIKNIKPHEKAA